MTARHSGERPARPPRVTDTTEPAVPVPLTPEEAAASQGPAEAVVQAYAEHQAAHGEGAVCAVQTSHGQVNIAALTIDTTPEGVAVVDVWLSGDTESGDPHFRIINPPLLVTGPGTSRDDPVGAVAEAIAMHGGAETRTRRRP